MVKKTTSKLLKEILKKGKKGKKSSGKKLKPLFKKRKQIGIKMDIPKGTKLLSQPSKFFKAEYKKEALLSWD